MFAFFSIYVDWMEDWMYVCSMKIIKIEELKIGMKYMSNRFGLRTATEITLLPKIADEHMYMVTGIGIADYFRPLANVQVMDND